MIRKDPGAMFRLHYYNVAKLLPVCAAVICSGTGRGKELCGSPGELFAQPYQYIQIEYFFWKLFLASGCFFYVVAG
ncbi:hypothetical protein, partial [Dyadobacter sp.]|uniref:hypothetical protein n=1 Tax=Dyadobacter sp. TaxID=1914288 RepID=UPI003F70A47D